jgi:hypothetical protein
MSNEHDVVVLTMRLNAANKTIQDRDFELDLLRSKMRLFESKEKQWELEKIKQLAIIQNTIGRMNTEQEQQRQEITALRTRLAERQI